MHKRTAKQLNQVQQLMKERGNLNTVQIAKLLRINNANALLKKLRDDGAVISHRYAHNEPLTWELVSEKHYEVKYKAEREYDEEPALVSEIKKKTQEEIIAENLARMRRRKVYGAQSSGNSLYGGSFASYRG